MIRYGLVPDNYKESDIDIVSLQLLALIVFESDVAMVHLAIPDILTLILNLDQLYREIQRVVVQYEFICHVYN